MTPNFSVETQHVISATRCFSVKTVTTTDMMMWRRWEMLTSFLNINCLDENLSDVTQEEMFKGKMMY